MKIETNQNQIVISGHLFLQDAERMIRSLKQALSAEGADLTINLDQVEAIDTGMLQILLATQKSAEQLKKIIRFFPISEPVAEVLEYTGLEPLFSDQEL